MPQAKISQRSFFAKQEFKNLKNIPDTRIKQCLQNHGNINVAIISMKPLIVITLRTPDQN
jgi:hypothetical protein